MLAETLFCNIVDGAILLWKSLNSKSDYLKSGFRQRCAISCGEKKKETKFKKLFNFFVLKEMKSADN